MPNGPSVDATRLPGTVGAVVSLGPGGGGTGAGGITGGAEGALLSAFFGATGSPQETISKPDASATSATEHSRAKPKFFVLRRGCTCAISKLVCTTPNWTSFYANVIFQHFDSADFSHTTQQEYYVQREDSTSADAPRIFCSNRIFADG